ncbi:MAG TPA: hypothetical protein VF876_15470 [Burkholderiales bacterium]
MKLFGGGKPDHPMADAKDARRILEQLPAQDAVKALDELAHWHESLSLAEGFAPAQRIELLVLVDDAAQPRARKLTRDYLGQALGSRFQENRLWTALHEYWRQAGLAFARGVDLFLQGAKGAEAARGTLPLLLARALRAAAQQIKWMHMRYGPYDYAVWGVLNRVYAFAEARRLAQVSVTLYPGLNAQSTPTLEFARAALFSAAAPEGLLPAEIDLAERIVGELAGHFAIAAAPAPGLPYWTDLDKSMAPQRALQPPAPAPGLRCFGAGPALEEVKLLAERIRATDALPSGLNLVQGDSPEMVLEVLEHLSLYWSPQSPERKHQRHRVSSLLTVASGLKGVMDTLAAAPASTAETWVIENVSAGGFGALVPQVKGDWLRVGALVAIQPEGGNNWVVGMIRRVSKNAGQQARVGIQTLSRVPAVSQFAVSGARNITEQGVLLRGNDPGSSDVQIALRPGVFAPGQNLEATRDGRRHIYMPTGFGERGEDYEIGRFRELVRES